MDEQTPLVHVSLPLPYAVVLSEWLASCDTAAGLAQRSVPLTDLTEKLALDHLWKALEQVPDVSNGLWRPKLEAARVAVEAERRRRLHYLVTNLLDRTLDIGARDDCAMDLGDFDDPAAFEALVRVGTDAQEDETVLASAGESLGYIVQRRPRPDFDADSLAPMARLEYEGTVSLDSAP